MACVVDKYEHIQIHTRVYSRIVECLYPWAIDTLVDDMSMDTPNEYEQAIEAYAEAVRRDEAAEKTLLLAQQEELDAREARQAAWRVIKGFLGEGHIKPGIYRLKSGTSLYSDGVLIEHHHDYPDLFPMFR